MLDGRRADAAPLTRACACRYWQSRAKMCSQTGSRPRRTLRSWCGAPTRFRRLPWCVSACYSPLLPAGGAVREFTRKCARNDSCRRHCTRPVLLCPPGPLRPASAGLCGARTHGGTGGLTVQAGVWAGEAVRPGDWRRHSVSPGAPGCSAPHSPAGPHKPPLPVTCSIGSCQRERARLSLAHAHVRVRACVNGCVGARWRACTRRCSSHTSKGSSATRHSSPRPHATSTSQPSGVNPMPETNPQRMAAAAAGQAAEEEREQAASPGTQTTPAQRLLLKACSGVCARQEERRKRRQAKTMRCRQRVPRFPHRLTISATACKAVGTGRVEEGDQAVQIEPGRE